MKKSFLTSLCALCTLFFVQAADYTFGDNNNTLSAVLPLTTSSSTYTSISQQLFLASDLTGIEAEAGDITALTFYYGGKSNNTAVRAVTRNIEIYISAVSPSFTEFEINSSTHLFKFVAPGTKVYDGEFATEAIAVEEVKTKKITLSNSFAWDGTKNIVITMFDKTNTKFYSTTDCSDVNLRFALIQVEPARFIHIHQMAESSDEFSTYKSSLADKEGEAFSTPYTDDGQRTSHHWVNRIIFSITPAAVVIPVPTNLAASSITTSSATLSWDAVDGATGYNVRWGKTSGSLDNSDNVATNSIDIDGLDDGETYYFDVQTIAAGGTSAWASEANFNTTAITHEHDDISFSKWASTTSMPTSGNYYLANNVTLDPYEPSTITLTGNLNLCLNGKTANLYGTKIVVPDDITFTIYDNVGGGKLTGFVESDVAWSELYSKALIVVYSGGTLVLKQGTIENTYEHNLENPSDGWSYAIYSNGTVRISGGVLINSNDADIYLNVSKVVTLDAAISNEEKHTVYITGGTFTSGWSTYMSAADPRDYFESANSGKSVCLSEGEAALRTLLHLSEESQNSGITTNYNQTVDVELTRSLTSAQYNTFCLPFALSAVQMAEFFGAGYDLEELTSSSLEEEILTLTFERKYALEAGKPYLLQPSIEVVNPSFEGVTITANMPDTIETTYADLRAIYRPTELAGDNHNLLFLGEDNTLFWPESTGNMNAFRAYFVVKGAAANAVQARIGRAESQTTAIENQHSHIDNHKYMKDGQLLIERNGVIYNAQGQTIK